MFLFTSQCSRIKPASFFLLLPVLLSTFSPPAMTQEDIPSFVLETEFGPGWQSRNDVKIPNDSLGTRFALDDISGNGPWLTARLNLLWNLNDKHGVRVLLAPLSYEETGILNTNVNFAGASFQADQPVEARYKFNSWRASYRYLMVDSDRWNLWIGGTLKVRDAEIKLTQNGLTSSDDDIGFVPLFYLASTYQFGERWSLKTELDALAGGPGRAIDLGLRLDYRINDQWSAGAGYRTLEGGADTDDIYNFAWFNSDVLSTSFRF